MPEAVDPFHIEKQLRSPESGGEERAESEVLAAANVAARADDLMRQHAFTVATRVGGQNSLVSRGSVPYKLQSGEELFVRLMRPRRPRLRSRSRELSLILCTKPYEKDEQAESVISARLINFQNAGLTDGKLYVHRDDETLPRENDSQDIVTASRIIGDLEKQSGGARANQLRKRRRRRAAAVGALTLVGGGKIEAWRLGTDLPWRTQAEKVEAFDAQNLDIQGRVIDVGEAEAPVASRGLGEFGRDDVPELTTSHENTGGFWGGGGGLEGGSYDNPASIDSPRQIDFKVFNESMFADGENAEWWGGGTFEGEDDCETYYVDTTGPVEAVTDYEHADQLEVTVEVDKIIACWFPDERSKDSPRILIQEADQPEEQR